MQVSNRKHVLAISVGALGALFLTGCIDESYDLAEVDTTLRIQVDNLTLPLNLAPVEFNDVIDLSEEDCIEVVDGEYVLVKSGEFDSEPITIRTIDADPTSANEVVSEQLYLVSGVTVPLTPCHNDFTYEHYGVDQYIVSLKSGKVDFNITTTVRTTNSAGNGVNCTYSDMIFTVPAGLYGECVETGETIDATKVNEITFNGDYQCTDGVFTFTYHVTEVDCEKADAKIVIDESTGERDFFYKGRIAMKQGKVCNNGAASTGNIDVEFALGSIHVSSICGRIYYDLEAFDIDPIVLNDLPDVLTDDSTNIKLVNPQIYLSLSNPLGEYGVEGSTGLKIAQERNDGQSEISAELVNPLVLKGIEGEQNYCVSPDTTVTGIPGYTENLTKVYMANLGNILSGNGLPDGLDIDFESPKMLERDVTDFRLGVDLGAVHGSYTFYAPLEFADGSRVIYSQTQTGWGLGTQEELEISALTISAHIESNLPIDIELSAKPVDEDGNIINTATISSVSVPAYETGKDIEMTMTGSIRNVDGMRYTVRIAAGQDASVLKPTMSLTLTNIKITVSGFYESVDDGDEDEEDTYDYDDYDDFQYYYGY